MVIALGKLKNVLEIPEEKPHAATVRSWRVLNGDTIKNPNLQFVDDDIVPPGYAIKSHVDNSDEVYYILTGKGEMTIGNETTAASEGDVFHIPPNTPHSMQNTGKRDLRFICMAIKKFA